MSEPDLSAELLRASERIAQLEAELARERKALLELDSMVSDGMNVAALAVLVVDPTGVILRASAMAEEVLGRSMSELLGLNYADPRLGLSARNGAELEPEELPLARLRQLEVPIMGLRVAVHWPGGTRRQISMNGCLLTGGGALLLLDDVSEQEAAMQALVRSEHRLQLALAAAGQGLWDLEVPRRRVLSDSGVSRILGYDRYSLPSTTQTVLALVHPVDREGLRAEVCTHLRGEVPQLAYRFRMRDASGRWRWVEINGRTIERDGQSRAKRVVGTVRDVSREVRSVQDKQRMDAHVARLARMESLSVLAGGVAHDYNNLLMAMLTGVTVAQEELGEHPARESLGLVQEAVHQAKALTQQLLAFSGRGEFVVAAMDGNEALGGMSQLLAALVGNRVALTIELSGQGTVVADRTQLQQVVMNLVINASQAMAGVGELRLSTRVANVGIGELKAAWASERAEAGPHLLICVQDWGPGMDAATQARIFEPFFTTRQDGHGLGLAAALGIVQGHRGFIQVSSAPGQGTTFTVGLPIAQEEPPAEPAPSAAPTPGEGLRRILVVDDQPLVLRVTSRMLRRLGWEVWEAGSGAEALVRYESNPGQITALLVDMNMPGMGGAELVERVRMSCADQPVVLMSGYEAGGLVTQLSQQHRVSFLAKPFFQSQLVEALDKVQK